MKICRNKIIPFQGYKYINLFGIIFTRSKNLKLNDIEYVHESIHTLQMKYMLYIFFYLFYFFEYIIKLCVSACTKDKGKYDTFDYAYRSVSFEQIAYGNEKNIKYLDTAKPYEWTKYIFKML